MALPPGDHVVTGTLSGLEPKANGWMRFSILEQGMDYPQKVDTKKPEIVSAATALMGQQVSAQVSVVDSGNPNPHRPGENFLNRYLNAIGPVGTIQPTVQGMAAATTQPRSGEDPVKTLRIARMNAADRAIQMAVAGMLPPDQHNPAGLVEAAEVWVAYYMQGPARFGVRAFDQIPTDGGNPGHEEIHAAAAAANPDGPPPADDEIPF